VRYKQEMYYLQVINHHATRRETLPLFSSLPSVLSSSPTLLMPMLTNSPRSDWALSVLAALVTHAACRSCV
jgi:hypothetical protein